MFFKQLEPVGYKLNQCSRYPQQTLRRITALPGGNHSPNFNVEPVLTLNMHKKREGAIKYKTGFNITKHYPFL